MALLTMIFIRRVMRTPVILAAGQPSTAPADIARYRTGDGEQR